MVFGLTHIVHFFLSYLRCAGHEISNSKQEFLEIRRNGTTSFRSVKARWFRLLCLTVLLQNFGDAFTSEVLRPLQRCRLKHGIADGNIGAVFK